MSNQTKKKTGCIGRMFQVGILGFLAFILLIIALVKMAPEKREESPTSPALPSAANEAGPILYPPGSIVKLDRPGGAGHAHLSKDDEAFELLKKALASNRMADFIALSDQGRVLRIDNGTKAKVLIASGEGRKVQLEEGPEAGTIGWVESKYIHE